MSKIYLAGHSGPEHNYVEGAYRNYDDAHKSFEKLRLDLLRAAKEGLKWSIKDAKESLKRGKWFDGRKYDKDSIKYFKKIAAHGSEMYKEIIKRLQEKDPKKIDNYPQETPYITEMELK